MATLAFHVKPGMSRTITSCDFMIDRDTAVNKFINSIFREKKIQALSKRIVLKDNKFMYTPSEEYLIRVKNL